eukprot:Sspe_Gene.118570::Locus_112281_Transcript_1_1_Confidence_1.000_Length_1220::g.118570::m.118570
MDFLRPLRETGVGLALGTLLSSIAAWLRPLSAGAVRAALSSPSNGRALFPSPINPSCSSDVTWTVECTSSHADLSVDVKLAGFTTPDSITATLILLLREIRGDDRTILTTLRDQIPRTWRVGCCVAQIHHARILGAATRDGDVALDIFIPLDLHHLAFYYPNLDKAVQALGVVPIRLTDADTGDFVSLVELDAIKKKGVTLKASLRGGRVVVGSRTLTLPFTLKAVLEPETSFLFNLLTLHLPHIECLITVDEQLSGSLRITRMYWPEVVGRALAFTLRLHRVFSLLMSSFALDFSFRPREPPSPAPPAPWLPPSHEFHATAATSIPREGLVGMALSHVWKNALQLDIPYQAMRLLSDLHNGLGSDVMAFVDGETS